MHIPDLGLHFDHAFRTTWFAGDEVDRNAEYPRVAESLVPSTGRRVYRAFLPLNVQPSAAGVYRGFALARTTNGESVDEEGFGGLRAKFALHWSRGQITDATSKTLGTPGGFTDLAVETPTSFAEAAASFSDAQSPPYLGYHFDCPSPSLVHAGAYWVQALFECQYGSEVRPRFRGVSRRMLDFRGSTDAVVGGRVYPAAIPRNMEEAALVDPAYLDATLFSMTWNNSALGPTFSNPFTGGHPILYLCVGLVR